MTQAEREALKDFIVDVVNVSVAKAVAGIDRESLRGPAGENGAPGERGLQGEKGADGAAGRDGRDGTSGPAGERGERGERGMDGRDGRDGITEERLQAAVAAMEARVAESIVKSIHFDGRNLMVGDVVLQTFATPIYRGVFTEGVYEPGDMVTWAGSVWHCEESTTERPGDGRKAWTLAVKKGRDAPRPEVAR
jgi:collagen type III alpha